MDDIIREQLWYLLNDDEMEDDYLEECDNWLIWDGWSD